MEITRYLPMKINYEAFRLFCLGLIAKMSQREEFKEDVLEIRFRDIINKEIVQDEGSFKNMLKYHTKSEIN